MNIRYRNAERLGADMADQDRRECVCRSLELLSEKKAIEQFYHILTKKYLTESSSCDKIIAALFFSAVLQRQKKEPKRKKEGGL